MVSIRFSGSEADYHQIEAYEGTKSLEGMARVATIAAHYAVTKEVRFRAPYSTLCQFHIVGVENGSLQFVFSEIVRIKNSTKDLEIKKRAQRLFQALVARGTGQTPQGELVIDDFVVPEGDLDSMAEASSAALTRAHAWIDNPTKSISLVQAKHDLVELNLSTKEYLDTEIVLEEESQDVSVGALNVNSRVGRVFFHDLGRTVPFKVARDAKTRTIPTLSRYLTQYAEKTGATVNIIFNKVLYPDDRLKRIIINDAHPVEDMD